MWTKEMLCAFFGAYMPAPPRLTVIDEVPLTPAEWEAMGVSIEEVFRRNRLRHAAHEMTPDWDSGIAEESADS